jgi:starch-binding outer membrane protein, SusD/RagB family
MKIFKYQLVALVTLFGLFTSCEILEPGDDNIYDLDDIRSVPAFAEGILLAAYRDLPTSHNNFNLSYASDDAVINDPTSNIKTVVSGGWTSNSNPFRAWNSAYESIFYLNYFLEEMNDIEWYWENARTDSLFAVKLKAEAHALRAWNYFHLLQAHAGKGTNGEMLGVPIVDKVLETTEPSDYEIPRSSFNDLVEFIIEDCKKARDVLPVRWTNTNDPDADIAIGNIMVNRINGMASLYIKAKTLLYAASPAFSDGTYTYQMAAEAAAEIMNLNAGLSSVNSANNSLLDFYSNPVVANYQRAHREVLWYSRRISGGQSWERSNYPPSLYGNGLTNPTQDLVNAFPMADGTPVPASKLNSANPYSDRDPRLRKYILYNGSQFKMGSDTVIINTTAGSQNAVGSTNNFATKTGYYLKKFMNVDNVNLDPTVNSGGVHYYTYVRYSDVLLMFAEAANEAVGPDGNIGGYTARGVINALRDRVGITSQAYVNGLDKAGMTELIRNERRIELCFEKQRFWDLRRWNLIEDMNKPVHGVQVSSDGNTYSYFQVESRVFPAHQIYGPIPYDETLKYSLIQNEGW